MIRPVSTQISATPKAKPRMAGIIIRYQIGRSLLTERLPGTSFAKLAVALPVARKQLAVPQLYPLGQHPAVGPAFVGHKDHPPAQAPVDAVAVTSVAGTAMVTPLEMMVV